MTTRVGLLGWPVEHSVSPAMHNAAFDALSLDWSYDALPVKPDDLRREVARLLDEGYAGFNVTIPHKQAVLELAQVADSGPEVSAIGAANTLSRLPGGELQATNTDWQGLTQDLRAHNVTLAGANCLILGTGGAARAVAYALRESDVGRVAFVSRTPAPGDSMIGYAELGVNGMPLETIDLILNCTPLGMFPNVEVSPWPATIPFPRQATLYDLIYNPPVTRLMLEAQSAGARAIGGLGMLVRQGALSFEQWTAIAPPLDMMEAAAKHVLFARHT